MGTLNLNKQKLCYAFFLVRKIFGSLEQQFLSSDYSSLGYIVHVHDLYFIYIIESSLVNVTNHVGKNFLSIV